MRYASPEKCGISTAVLKKYIDYLDKNNLSTHSVIIARGDNIVLEKYWAPFHREFKHRLYSVTKSFVALALGFLADEGKISLDDPICKYFPKETAGIEREEIRTQTIRHMLMMSTALPKHNGNWFAERTDDRVQNYFQNCGIHYSDGTIFSYDSTGSFVLGALAERVSGKTLTEYLNEKMFDEIGVEGAYCLRCPGGHSWGDSALIMRPIDLLRSARFVMNGGSWKGHRLLSESFVKEATSNLTATDPYGYGNIDGLGYGYLFWRTKNNSFFFNGMGCQLAICMPDKDLILVYNGDNQDNALAKSRIIDGFFDIVYDTVEDAELPEYTGEPIAERELFCLSGAKTSSVAERINGKRYLLESNPMGISEFCVTLNDEGGSFNYINKTGAHTINFGFGRNVFEKFTETGYADEVGSVFVPGTAYDSAASADWVTDYQLRIRVQIIDKYFGNLGIIIGFVDDKVGIHMKKFAEDFLHGYQGFATGTLA